MAEEGPIITAPITEIDTKNLTFSNPYDGPYFITSYMNLKTDSTGKKVRGAAASVDFVGGPFDPANPGDFDWKNTDKVVDMVETQLPFLVSTYHADPPKPGQAESSSPGFSLAVPNQKIAEAFLQISEFVENYVKQPTVLGALFPKKRFLQNDPKLIRGEKDPNSPDGWIHEPCYRPAAQIPPPKGDKEPLCFLNVKAKTILTEAESAAMESAQQTINAKRLQLQTLAKSEDEDVAERALDELEDLDDAPNPLTQFLVPHKPKGGWGKQLETTNDNMLRLDAINAKSIPKGSRFFFYGTHKGVRTAKSTGNCSEHIIITTCIVFPPSLMKALKAGTCATTSAQKRGFEVCTKAPRDLDEDDGDMDVYDENGIDGLPSPKRQRLDDPLAMA